MDRVENQITRIRTETENTDFGDTYGISDNEMIAYLNDAQDRIYAEINKRRPYFFVRQTVLTSPANTEALDLPSKLYLGHISNVEYSQTGGQSDYSRLEQGSNHERDTNPGGNPLKYFRNNNQLFLIPTPSSGGFVRIRYIERVPKLDKRRAKVASATFSGSSLTALTLDTTVEIDRDNLLTQNYMCVVDKYGSLKVRAIPFTDINSTTGVVTLETFSLGSDDSTISAGDYVVMGDYTCNKSSLDDITERYLVSHLRMEVLDRDGNTSGTATQNDKMNNLLGEIIDTFSDVSYDVYNVAVIDENY